MNAPNERLSGAGSAQARRHGGEFGGIYVNLFVPPKIALCSEKFVSNIW